jgi:hypothetical protein
VPGAAFDDDAWVNLTQAGGIHFHFLAFMGTTAMSSLQKFLPASEPARSEALALLAKAHHLPRHLVRGIAQAELGKRGLVARGEPQQNQQQEPPEKLPVAGQPLQPS